MTIVDPQENTNEEPTPDTGDNQEIETIHIDSDTFYRPADIRRIFGIRFVGHLTQLGLRSLGGWYRGKRILEAYEQAAQNKSCQRVSAGKEVMNEAKHAKVKMEKAIQRRKIQSVSRSEAKDSLRSQLEKVQRQVR